MEGLEGAGFSCCKVRSTRLHGASAQKTAVFMLFSIYSSHTCDVIVFRIDNEKYEDLHEPSRLAEAIFVSQC
jgi:lipoate synthase